MATADHAVVARAMDQDFPSWRRKGGLVFTNLGLDLPDVYAIPFESEAEKRHSMLDQRKIVGPFRRGQGLPWPSE